MKKYNNCPSNYQIIEETDKHVKLSIPSKADSGGRFELLVPELFWERFCRDPQWQQSMGIKYAKLVGVGSYPTNRRFKALPLQTEYTGVIPIDEPFSITHYENCPVTFFKVDENDNYIKLQVEHGHWSLGLIELVVPSLAWSRFTEDKKWRSAMVNKYGRLLYLDSNPSNVDIPESELHKSGVIPENEI